MKEHIRNAGQFVQEALNESARQARKEHEDAMHLRGFSSAAGIALGCIEEKLDGFKQQMKGPGLTKTEQAAYAQLDELKSEVEANLDRYWRGSGLEWRPPRPIAKGVRRRSGETGS